MIINLKKILKTLNIKDIVLKSIVLIICAIILTIVGKTYIFQKILSTYILRVINNNVLAPNVKLGLYNLSFNSVIINDLKYNTNENLAINVKKISVIYDFIESMKDNALIKSLTLKNPILKINSLNAIQKTFSDYFSSNISHQFDLISKIPQTIYIKDGELEIENIKMVQNINCNMTNMNDCIILNLNSNFSNLGFNLELSVTCDLKNMNLTYKGMILNYDLKLLKIFSNTFLKEHFDISTQIFNIQFEGELSLKDLNHKSKLQVVINDGKINHFNNLVDNLILFYNFKPVINLNLNLNNFKINSLNIDLKNLQLVVNNQKILINFYINYDFINQVGNVKINFLNDKNKPLDLKYKIYENLILNTLSKININIEINNGIYTVNGFLDYLQLKYNNKSSYDVNLKSVNVSFNGNVNDISYGNINNLNINGEIECKNNLHKFNISSLKTNEFKVSIHNLLDFNFNIINSDQLEVTTHKIHLKENSLNVNLKLFINLLDKKLTGNVTNISYDDIISIFKDFSYELKFIPKLKYKTYNLDFICYLESEKVIGNINIVPVSNKVNIKNSKNNNNPLIASTFNISFLNNSFNFKIIGNILRLLDENGLFKFPFFKAIFINDLINKEIVINALINNNIRLITLNIANFLTLEYDLFNFKLTYKLINDICHLNGVLNFNTLNLNLNLKILNYNSNMLFKVLEFLKINELNLDYSNNIIKIFLPKTKNTCFLEAKLFIETNKNFTISLNDVKLSILGLLFNGKVTYDLNSCKFLVKGQLLIKNLFSDYPILAFLFKDAFDITIDIQNNKNFNEINVKLQNDIIKNLFKTVIDIKLIFNNNKFKIITNAIKIVNTQNNITFINFDLNDNLNEKTYLLTYKLENFYKNFELIQKHNILNNLTIDFKNNDISWFIQDYVKNINLSGNLKINSDFKFLEHNIDLVIELINNIKLSTVLNLNSNFPLGFKVGFIALSIFNTTYKGKCLVENDSHNIKIQFNNVNLTLSQLFEIIFNLKTDIIGETLNDILINITKNNEFIINSKTKIFNSKINLNILNNVLEQNNLKFNAKNLILNSEIILENNCNIFNQFLNAFVNGNIKIKDSIIAPTLVGDIDILYGKINYLNNYFNITSGNFKISTIKNLSKNLHSKLTIYNSEFSSQLDNVNSNDKTCLFNFSCNNNLNLFNETTSFNITTNITAVTKVDAYQINLNLFTNGNNFNVYLTSKPELSTEAIHMLLYGVSPNSISISQGGETLTTDKFIDVLNSKIQDAFYQKLSSSLEKKLNLDEVKINTYRGNNMTLLEKNSNNKSYSIQEELMRSLNYKDIEVKIGKYIDADLYLSYNKNLFSPKNDSLEMEYKFRKNFSVGGEVNQNLEYKFGAKYGIPF